MCSGTVFLETVYINPNERRSVNFSQNKTGYRSTYAYILGMYSLFLASNEERGEV